MTAHPRGIKLKRLCNKKKHLSFGILSLVGYWAKTTELPDEHGPLPQMTFAYVQKFIIPTHSLWNKHNVVTCLCRRKNCPILFWGIKNWEQTHFQYTCDISSTSPHTQKSKWFIPYGVLMFVSKDTGRLPLGTAPPYGGSIYMTMEGVGRKSFQTPTPNILFLMTPLQPRHLILHSLQYTTCPTPTPQHFNFFWTPPTLDILHDFRPTTPSPCHLKWNYPTGTQWLSGWRSGQA